MLRCVGIRIGRRFSPYILSSQPTIIFPQQQQQQQQQQCRTLFLLRGIGSYTPALMQSAALAEKVVVDDSFGIATGPEREELEADQKGLKRFDLEPPRGPFGTKDAPAIVQSHFDERIVGCSGGIGEEEHDVVWFKLKKGELYECSVCSQVFQLEVVGEGGKPGGHHH